jgi:hypothetical protein
MKSSTAYKISKIFYNQPTEFTDATWREIDSVFGDDINEIVSSIDSFLLELSNHPRHEVPGKVWLQLQDMAYQAKKTNSLSQKQQRYITLALVSYWDQTQLEFL